MNYLYFLAEQVPTKKKLIFLSRIIYFGVLLNNYPNDLLSSVSQFLQLYSSFSFFSVSAQKEKSLQKLQQTFNKLTKINVCTASKNFSLCLQQYFIVQVCFLKKTIRTSVTISHPRRLSRTCLNTLLPVKCSSGIFHSEIIMLHLMWFWVIK